MKNAHAALARLKAGNQRFVSGLSASTVATDSRPFALVKHQNPFAIIIGCSDSRVPAEIIFNQGIGDLFVIRVAGNVITPAQMGSVEFAAERLDSRLVLVLGHSNCGMVEATIENWSATISSTSMNMISSPHIQSLVDKVRLNLESVLENANLQTQEELIKQAVRANICASVNQLRQGSHILETLMAEDGLMVVGAEYDVHSGKVDFFDDLP